MNQGSNQMKGDNIVEGAKLVYFHPKTHRILNIPFPK